MVSLKLGLFYSAYLVEDKIDEDKKDKDKEEEDDDDPDIEDENLYTNLWKNFTFYIQHGTLIFLSYMNSYVASLLGITKAQRKNCSVSKFVWFEVSCWFVVWTLIWLIGV